MTSNDERLAVLALRDDDNMTLKSFENQETTLFCPSVSDGSSIMDDDSNASVKQSDDAKDFNGGIKKQGKRTGEKFLMLLSCFTDLFSINICLPILPILVEKLFEKPAVFLGLLLSAASPAHLVAAVVYGGVCQYFIRQKWDPCLWPFISASLVVSASAILFIASMMLKSLALAFVARVLMGFGGGGLYTIALVMCGLYWNEKEQQGILALSCLAQVVGECFGVIAGGALFSVGRWVPFILIVVLGVGESFLRYFSVRLFGSLAQNQMAEPEMTNEPDKGLENPRDMENGLEKTNGLKKEFEDRNEPRLKENENKEFSVADEEKMALSAADDSKLITILIGLLNLTLIATMTLPLPGLPSYLMHTYDLSSFSIGLVFIYYLVPRVLFGIIGSILTNFISRTNTMLLGLAISLSGCFLSTRLTAQSNLHLFGFSLALTAGGLAMSIIICVPFFMGRFDKQQQGVSSGFSNLLYSLGNILGYTLGGFLFEAIGWSGIMTVCGCMAVFQCFILFYLAYQINNK